MAGFISRSGAFIGPRSLKVSGVWILWSYFLIWQAMYDNLHLKPISSLSACCMQGQIACTCGQKHQLLSMSIHHAHVCTVQAYGLRYEGT
jgi:hypothetical protein